MVVDHSIVRRAYRVNYEREIGPVPEGLELHHRCEDRACVNPHHLEAITHTHNMRLAKNTKLTLDKAREIRRRKAAGETSRALAQEFGVTKDMVNKLLSGRYWRE